MNADDFRFAQTAIRPIPGADTREHGEQGIGDDLDIGAAQGLVAHAGGEDFSEDFFVTLPQGDDLGVVLRFQTAQFEIDDEDLGLPRHVIMQVESNEGAQPGDRFRDLRQFEVQRLQQVQHVAAQQVHQQILLGADVVVERALLQPDFGGTILFAGVWFVIVLLAGIPLKRVGILAGAGVVALTATYFLYDNARHRIDAFLGGGTAFDQVDLASRTLLAGGWTGAGLWLGVRKMNLPEAHTDYIFSVIGEEFGLIVCAIIVLLYLAIIVRVLTRLVDEEDLFTLLAAAMGFGLAILVVVSFLKRMGLARMDEE